MDNIDESKKNKDIKERLKDVSTYGWIKFSIVSLIFILWVIWLGSWWVMIFYPLIADMYLTKYIPWTWWKKSRNKMVRNVMGWVDAIVYALVMVYFLFAFIGQNYQIPSSSLEKTLLVGDYLWVNKALYGPRVPMTPLHFPLAQHTLPILNTKSYIDYPQWEYRRLKGIRNIERNDIVVFNFPAGDTVALKVQNPDYYTLVKQYGRDAVTHNKDVFGDVIFRPVDRRENYVKRAIGLPGEKLRIVDDVVYIDGKPLAEPKNIQYNYLVQTDGRPITDEVWESVDVSKDDRNLIQISSNEEVYTVISLGLQATEDGKVNPIYQVPLTNEAKGKLKKLPWITGIVKMPAHEMMNMYPITQEHGWTRANYGEIWIPKKGETLKLTLENLPVYERPIKNYEGNDLKVENGIIYINGKPTDKYKFKMDYYFMMGDNRDNSADSRYRGFVPEDHVVGTPMFVLISFDKDKNIFNGGLRWNRIFKDANPDK